jgi:hypothetical protein
LKVRCEGTKAWEREVCCQSFTQGGTGIMVSYNINVSVVQLAYENRQQGLCSPRELLQLHDSNFRLLETTLVSNQVIIL